MSIHRNKTGNMFLEIASDDPNNKQLIPIFVEFCDYKCVELWEQSRRSAGYLRVAKSQVM